MKNRVLVGLIIIAAVFSLLSIMPRYNIEKSNRGVELVIDANYLNELIKKTNTDRNNILKLFKENGLTGVAIYPDSVRSLINDKKARLITGNELKRVALLTSSLNSLYRGYSFNDDSAFFVVEDNKVKGRILTVLSDWCERYDIKYRETDDKLLIFFNEWKTKYLDLTIGFQDEVIKNIKSAGLEVVLRLDNDIEGYKQWDDINKIDTELIIFSGSEVAGYKDDIDKTARMMRNNDIKFGMIESFIAKQAGSGKLAELLNYNIIRVHSMQQREMDKYGLQKIIDRYLRAVRERNVRVLYLKPFLQEKNEKLINNNLEFVKMLTAELKREGYNPTAASPYPYFQSPLLYLFITGIGIFAGGILLLEALLARKLKLSFYILSLLAALSAILLIFKGKTILLRQLLALGSSIIFPVLAVITAVNKSQSEKWLLSFLKAAGISLLGVLYLTASLSELSFMLKVNQFRGVKLSFLIPLLLISYYYYKKYVDIDRGNKSSILKLFADILETEIKIKHLLLLLLIGIGGIIYIGRTGNYPILPVPAWEISLRSLLERYLYVRPRFKAFLFGHPFLVLTLYLIRSKNYKLALYPIILLASVGQVTILNTFSHIHTPLKISLIRFANGIWLGLLLGIILIVVLKFMGYLKEKLYA